MSLNLQLSFPIRTSLDMKLAFFHDVEGLACLNNKSEDGGVDAGLGDHPLDPLPAPDFRKPSMEG